MDWNDASEREGDDRGNGGSRRGPRIPERLMRLLTTEPFAPIRVFAGGWVWELRSREAMVVAGPGMLRGLARRPGHPQWIDLELRASQIIAIEVDSRLFEAQDWSSSEETP
jgi:hypothetical protein